MNHPINWKSPAVPRHVLQMLVFDSACTLLVIHRSDKVKSAKNVWSIPTGTHEIGETAKSCIKRELDEEFGLYASNSFIIDQYENIAGDDPSKEQYHWVLSIYGVLVPSVREYINKEPDLHDQVEVIPFIDFTTPEFFNEHPFHPSLHTTLKNNAFYYIDRLRRVGR